MWGFNVFVNSVNSNYVSFSWLCHTHVPDFMLMCCSVCVGAMTASKWALAPRGESAMLNIHSTAYEFKAAPHCCMLK